VVEKGVLRYAAEGFVAGLVLGVLAAVIGVLSWPEAVVPAVVGALGYALWTWFEARRSITPD
jgi:hypothetical protein